MRTRGLALLVLGVGSACESARPATTDPILASVPAGFEEGVRRPATASPDDVWVAGVKHRGRSAEEAQRQAIAIASEKLASTRRTTIRSELMTVWREETTDGASSSREEVFSKLEARSAAELSGLVPRVCGTGPDGDAFVAWVEVTCPARTMFPQERLMRFLRDGATVEQLLDLASAYEVENYPELAELALLLACEKHPDDARAHMRLARSCDRLDNERRALLHFERVVAVAGPTEAVLAQEARERIAAIRNRVPTMDALATDFVALGLELQSAAPLSLHNGSGGELRLVWQDAQGVRMLITRIDRDLTLYVDRKKEPAGADAVRGNFTGPLPQARTTFVIWALPVDAAAWPALRAVKGKTYSRAQEGAESDRWQMRELLQMLRSARPATRVVELP